jgi:hypothetical protein
VVIYLTTPTNTQKLDLGDIKLMTINDLPTYHIPVEGSFELDVRPYIGHQIPDWTIKYLYHEKRGRSIEAGLRVLGEPTLHRVERLIDSSTPNVREDFVRFEIKARY